MKKHITTKILALALCASVLTISCKNDKETFRITPGSASNFNELRTKALENLTQIKTFTAEDGITFTSNKGAKLTINPNCLFDNDNNLVTGDVKMSFIEIYDRGDMVLTNKPVMGFDNDGNKLPLVTGGQFNIEIKKGNETLRHGCTFTISIPAKNTGTFDEEMSLWKGNINENGDLEWEQGILVDGEKNEGLQGNKENSSYNIWGNTFGWTNVDRFYNDPRPKTKIKVTVPTGYNNNNAGVYLAYEGERNVLAQLDTYDLDEKYFSEHYGFIPVGLKVNVIFVSESNGTVVHAIKQVTITQNATINIADADLMSGTLSQVTAKINALN